MNIMEKSICIKFNNNFMTLTFDTFLSIIFENIKTEICYYGSIVELDNRLKLIQELNSLNNEDQSYINIDFNNKENKDLFITFASGLLERAKYLLDYSLNQ